MTEANGLEAENETLQGLLKGCALRVQKLEERLSRSQGRIKELRIALQSIGAILRVHEL